jgi:hypothetical protein
MRLLGPVRRTLGAVALSLGTHCTQSCVAEQTGVCIPEQFVLLRHWTHLVVVWSQYGVLPKHWPSLEHPGWQVKVLGSQK